MVSPTPGTSLDGKYEGPFTILDRVGPVHYIIATPERQKTKRIVQVQSFLGIARYFMRYILHMVLSELVKKGRFSSGRRGARRAFLALKSCLASRTVFSFDPITTNFLLTLLHMHQIGLSVPVYFKSTMVLNILLLISAKC